jgi:CheY-like chemotaxis protein
MLGHELRNPLAAISNALECQRLAQDDDILVQDAQAILERQVQQMSRLVDDLLDVSRITQGKVELRQEIVDLTAIVRRAVTATAAMVSARSHQLSIAMPPGPLLLFADPTRMEQILANLINNAAKYTEPEGKISVVVERSKYSLVVRVIDNGIGIPEKLLPQIFELFTQGDRSLDRSQGGLGIGLTLVQRLVEMHGGEVHAESRGPNKGTEFVVRLPEHKPEPSAKNTESNGSETGEITAAIRRVLLVDDNQDLTFTMSMLLKKAGHEVRVASDGPASLELAASWHPEIMLIDIGLPGLNGYEVAKRVRDHVALQDSILIAMTGYGQAEDRQRSHEAGFDHHLVKPADISALQSLLVSLE